MFRNLILNNIEILAREFLKQNGQHYFTLHKSITKLT